MAIAIIQLPIDGSGKMIAARSYTESSNTVYAQAGYLTTDTAGGNPAAVQNTVPAGTEYALVTRALVSGTQPAATTASWTSATTVNTAATATISGYNTVSVAMVNTSTMTAGALTFEVSPDGTNWLPVAMQRIDGSYIVESTYLLNQVLARGWSTSVDGFVSFRVRLSTAITGTGTASIFIIPQTFAIEPIVTAGLQSPLKNTYHVGARAIATGTLTAGTAKAVLSFEHAATSTKTMKIQKILVGGSATTAVAGATLDLQITRGTAASSGGTSITPGAANPANAAADTVAKSLPTITAATVVDTIPITATPSTTAVQFNTVVAYDYSTASERQPFTLRASTLDTLVLNAISSGATAYTLTISVIFTEE